MQENFWLIVFLVIFFVLPSVLKLLGRRVAGTRNAHDRQDEDRMSPAPGGEDETFPSYPEHFPPDTGDVSERPVISNKPIHPKWF